MTSKCQDWMQDTILWNLSIMWYGDILCHVSSVFTYITLSVSVDRVSSSLLFEYYMTRYDVQWTNSRQSTRYAEMKILRSGFWMGKHNLLSVFKILYCPPHGNHVVVYDCTVQCNKKLLFKLNISNIIGLVQNKSNTDHLTRWSTLWCIQFMQ